MPVWTRSDFDRFYSVHAEPWGAPPPRGSIGQHISLHYHDWYFGKYQRERYAPMLFNLLGMSAGDTVLLVGCGFNWTGEGLEALGAEVVGVDTSQYIQDNKGLTEEAELREALIAVGIDPDNDTIRDDGSTQYWGVAGMNYLDVYMRGGRSDPVNRGHGTISGEDMSNNGSRNRVAGLMSKNPDYLITEETLNAITDAECIQLLNYIQSFMNTKGAAGYQIVHVLSSVNGPGGNNQPEMNWKSYPEWRAFLDTNGHSSHKILPSVTADGYEAYGALI